MSFNTALNFTSANEDGQTELLALQLKPTDRVLCLTASGARPLDLLLGNPAQIIALDMNASQNRLLELKIAAYKTLGVDDLYAFLGLTPCPDRLGLYRKVETSLSQQARIFWQGKTRAIRKGIWYSGRWERVLALGAFGTRLIRGNKIGQLFSTQNLAAQAKIWDMHFDDWIWKNAIRLLSRKWFWVYIIGEPGGAFLPSSKESERRLAGVFRRGAQNVHFFESDFIHLLLQGRHDITAALPLHLQRHNIEIIKSRLDRIEIIHGGLTDISALNLDYFDAFSLSDFGSYCSQKDYDDCWRSIIGAANKSARYCERVFMNFVKPSAEFRDNINLNTSLSDELTLKDKAIIYDIRCGEIKA